MRSPHEVNEAITLKAALREAALYWEPRCIVYNTVLAVVVAAWFVQTWPYLRPALSMQGLLALMLLAIIANTCHCAPYLVEAVMRRSPLRTIWPRARGGGRCGWPVRCSRWLLRGTGSRTRSIRTLAWPPRKVPSASGIC